MMNTLEMYSSAKLSETAMESHLKEWDVMLCEVGAQAFDAALTDCIRNCKFFPTVAELRERAGLKQQDERDTDAVAGWDYVRRYLRWWGSTGNPICSGGKLQYPPELPPRIEYAVRRAGGLKAIEYCYGEDNEPFVRRDFNEGFRLAEVAEQRGYIGSGEAKQLLGGIKALAAGKTLQ